MNVVQINSLPKFFQLVSAAVRKYGKQNLKSWDSCKNYHYLLGFESPEEIVCVKLNTIKSYYSKNRPLAEQDSGIPGVVKFGRISNEELVRLYSKDLKDAYESA